MVTAPYLYNSAERKVTRELNICACPHFPGRNSVSAVVQSTLTKIQNQSIQNISNYTAAKMFTIFSITSLPDVGKNVIDQKSSKSKK